ncbi:MAG: 50S ribosomal protein L30 [Christensenellales bacterium]|jgi:large subunit ribosomal protein L30
MSKVKITLVKSTNSCKKNQKATVEALGLKRIGSAVIKESNPCIDGMIFTVKHLVAVEEIQS